MTAAASLPSSRARNESSLNALIGNYSRGLFYMRQYIDARVAGLRRVPPLFLHKSIPPFAIGALWQGRLNSAVHAGRRAETVASQAIFDEGKYSPKWFPGISSV